MTLAAIGIYLVMGADPLLAVVLSVLTVAFMRFVEMWGD
jgi:hypothetical protein